ncbi:MAG TPA: Ku protein [Chitinivibrionales bacterium]|jgi:DNA end-binding protein Ku|nr:Ku protein [Chitinivibrionales bacterium]
MKKPTKASAVSNIGKKTESAPKEIPSQGIWSGTVSFSLVAIPVRLVKSVEPGRVSFHMLHTKDYSPLERRMVCPEEEKIVPPEEIIRGFEIEPGKHVTVTDEELESVSPDRSRTIEITEFIDTREVDPIYYDHPYFLVPLKGGEKSYRLLAESMQRTNKAGVAKFVLDEREYLVLIMTREGALALSMLHYSDEILPGDTLAPAADEAPEDEKNDIKRRIKGMMTDFAPEKYSNDRREKLLDLINKKVKKKAEVEAPVVEEEEKTEGMADLMVALEKSMHKVKKGR